MIVTVEPNVFLATPWLTETFRHCVNGIGDHPHFRDREPGTIVLSDGAGAAGAFVRLDDRTWVQYLEFIGSYSESQRIEAARAMVRWLFDHGAEAILCATYDDKWHAFNEAIGARSTFTRNGLHYYLISRAVQ